MLKNIVKHFITITKHKWLVFKLCVKVGIPFRGIVHDLSKYSPTEFWESVKYYRGIASPIPVAREKEGYSKAWLHHKGRNKHHYEYWYDHKAKTPLPIIPYPYAIEMVCDNMAAGMVYNGKNWTNQSQLEYWNRNKDTELLNDKMKGFFEEVFVRISEQGIDKVLNKKTLKELYQKHCQE